MSQLTETLKKQLDERRTAASEAFAVLTKFREEKGDVNIAADLSDGGLFEQTSGLHKTYGDAADEAKNLEAALFKALAFDDEPSPLLKEVGADAGLSRKDVREALSRVQNLLDKSMETVGESDSYKNFVKTFTDDGGGNGAQRGTLFQVSDAIKRAELKTLLTGVLDGQPVFLLPDLQPGYVEGFTRVRNVMTNLITIGTTENDTVDWIQENLPTWAAIETPEAVDADKTAGDAPSTAPESALDFERMTTAVQEIKHFIPATKRTLADIGQLRTIADQELLYGLQARLDGQIIGGDGTGENLLGILNTSGIQTQARGTDPQVEAIHKAFTKLLIAGYDNLSVVIHASDWETIRLSKDEIGQYYYGPPSLSGAQVIWGYPVTLSQRLDVGTAIAADFRRACTLWLRAGASIVATDSHSDWFLKGIIAILASMRCAFAVTRPLGVCEVTEL